MATASLATNSPWLEIEERATSLGEVRRHTVVEHVFEVVNNGPRDVTISEVAAALQSGEAEATPAKLAPGARGRIAVRQPVGDRLGLTTFRFMVRSDDPGGPERKLSLDAFVFSGFEPENLTVDLGSVDRDRGGAGTIEVASREVPSLQVLEVASRGRHLAISATPVADDPQRLVLRVELEPGSPEGLLEQVVVLRTNVPAEPLVRLIVAARVLGELVPSELPIDLGLERVESTAHKLVEIRTRSGADFRIVGVESSGPMDIAVEPCEGVSEGCQRLRLSRWTRQPGPVAGEVTVSVEGRPPLRLRYGGIVAQSNARIVNLGEVGGWGEGGLTVTSDGTKTTPAAPVRPEGSEVEVVEVGGERPGGGPVATVRWTVGLEDRIFGYLIYRSTNRSGPFQLVNREIVRAPSSPGPHRYLFYDHEVEAGASYHYYVDYVTVSGLKQRLTGVATVAVGPGGAD